MKINAYRSEAKVLLDAKGRLILEECEAFRGIVEPLMASPTAELFLNLAQVEYLDSAGLGALVDLRVRAGKRKIRLAIVAPSPGVASLLTISRLCEIFEIVTGMEAERLSRELMVDQNCIQRHDTEGAKVRPVFQSVASVAHSEISISPTTDSFVPQQEMTSARTEVEESCRQAVEQLRLGNLDESVRFYLEAIKKDPYYIPARNNLAIVYEKKPEWRQEAIAQWEKLLELSRQVSDERHVERAHKHLAKLKAR